MADTQRIVVVESGHSVAWYLRELIDYLVEAGPDAYERVADTWVRAATPIVGPDMVGAYRTLAVASYKELQHRREVL